MTATKPVTNDSSAGPVEIRLSTGAVRGRREAVRGGVVAFRGVPYGVSEGRFGVPRGCAAWGGVLAADGDVGTVPWQPVSPVGALMGDPAPGVQTEECLTVNVWAPEPGEGPRPVLVWLPGGNFLTGGADLPRYDGAELAAQERIVVVVVNHRLGALGFLAPEWAGPAELVGSGAGVDFKATSGSGYVTNAGLLDQIAALRWVKNEVRAFGGDPERITVAGQSSGAQGLAALLALPQVRPLFRRAVLHSPPLAGTAPGREEAAETAARFLDAAGVRDPEGLRALPAERILAAQQQTGPRFGPVVDGAVVLAPDPLEALRAAPPLDGVDVLTGVTRNECALWLGLSDNPAHATREGALDVFRARFGERAEEALDRYVATAVAVRDVLPTAVEDLQSDTAFAVPTQRLAATLHALGARTRLYRFDWQVPGRNAALRACHCLDVAFLLGGEQARRAPLLADADPAETASLRRRMRALWGEYVRTGLPAPEDEWPAYDPAAPAVRVVGGDLDGVVLRSLLEPGRVGLW
ncbi:carboxylic ester hydrolase [Streptomyces mashuensis]|uniref:Carboxylic ester hydrolase n=1 Tax=Streptomyces mashuensis TaxID=33904 RepID=A0A919AWB6_9ACTN|nr:carboxylesterase family protein [Streptomyces mashuensis]GHF26661.1 carboxylic ester hydrolase [Streptomyces mashuensis]